MVLFLFLFVYSYLKTNDTQGITVLLVVIVTAMVLLRSPRWLVYAFVIIAMILLIYHFTLIDALGPDDSISDRDDAVEIGASAITNGENPWSQNTMIDNPITTGPSNMILSLPSVFLTGKVNLMSFFMWIVFLLFLVAGDLYKQNNTFLFLSLLMLFSWMNFMHTWHWSLDELYYAAILSPLVWLALTKDRLVLAGFLASFMVFSRLGYAYAVFAIGLWWIMRERRRAQEYLRIAAGAMVFCVPMLLLLYAIGENEFIHHNFINNSLLNGLSDQSNWLVHSVTYLLEIFPDPTMGSAVIIIGILFAASFGMRSIPHPFFHMALGLFLAHTIAYSPLSSNDYMLVWMIPVMYGIAFSNNELVQQL